MYDGDADKSPGTTRLTLMVDDHPLYCDAMCCSLTAAFEGQRVRAVHSLRDAIALLETGIVPDLVLLDLGLPDSTGINGLLSLQSRIPQVPVVVISADSGDETIQSAMDAGAAGFIPKGAARDVMTDAIEQIQEGAKFWPPEFCPRPQQTPENSPDAVDVSQRLAALTPQQSRIINLICAGKPNKVIAYELSVTEGTVKAHITALLRRLGVQNRTQAAILANSVYLQTGAATGADLDART